MSERDHQMVSIQRWALSVISEELIGAVADGSGCGGENAEEHCPVCRALALAKAACDE